ncbi:trypsin-like peptidase domain-containing protein [Micromonospora sp. NPDC002296]|uniref:VMAP-C domain-containing protein n=1 Tax=Micromonospora sp. NPDC002296 TaxID=3154271 RepID=UPI0033235082
MNEAVDWAEHLRGCLVKVVAAAAGQPGSGFFVAPGTVLTSAHVVGATGVAVTVWWRGAAYPGVVSAASARSGDGGRIWPYPDLAVIEVSGIAAHPCAWLSTRPSALGKRCVVAGYSAKLGPVLEPAVRLLESTGSNDYLSRRLVTLGKEEIAPGMSGGPVLDPVTGGVWGVVKATRGQGGGFVVPIGGLRELDSAVHVRLWRAHDTHHRPDGPSRWPAVPGCYPSSYLTLEEERELRGIMAELPVGRPADHTADYRRMADSLLRESGPHHDYGDVISDLIDLVPVPGELPPLLVYVADLARRHPTHTRLRDWLLYRAGRLNLSDRIAQRLAAEPSSSAAVSVMVRLRPAYQDHRRYHVTMWRYVDAEHVVPVLDELKAVPWETAKQRVQSLLVEQIALLTAHERDIMIEFILPQELLSEPIHGWTLWPRRPWETLGGKYAVVVRDLERLEDAECMAFLRTRYRAAGDRAVVSGLLAVGCDDKRDHQAMWGLLSCEEYLSMVALPGPPDRPPAQVALDVALSTGVPALAWCVPGCAGCPGTDCVGSSSQQGLVECLADARVTDLPRTILRLRRAAAKFNRADHWGLNVVLLWDDPVRQPPRQRMLPPGEVELA